MIHNTNALDTEISAGIFWKPLPSTITYEATIPLTYKTSWNKDDFEANTRKSCPNHTSVMCQLEKHLYNLNEIFRNEQKLLQQSWDISEFQTIQPARHRRALDFIGRGLEWCCGVATEQKLSSLTANEKQAEEEITKLHNGLKNTMNTIIKTINKVDDYQNKIGVAFNVTNAEIQKIEKWIHTYATEIRDEDDRTIYFLAHNQILLLKNLIQTTRDVRKERIIRECRTNKIPSEVVSSKRLLKDLNHLVIELENFDHGLAIPLSDFTRYYQLDIAECVFTEESLIVHVKIPIKHRYHSWHLFELITAPFAWYNNTCIIDHNPLYLAVSDISTTKKEEHRQISGSRLHYCTPYNNKLCYLPRYAGDRLQGPGCASTIFKGASVEDISHQCQLKCKRSTHLTITEVEEETYIITHPTGNTKVVCKNTTHDIRTDYHNHIGALKIHLPCSCQLYDADQIIIPERYPCPSMYDTHKMLHVIPAIWTNLKSFVLKPSRHSTTIRFHNASDCLNHQWTMNIPHENLTNIKEAAKIIQQQIEDIATSKPSLYDEFGHHLNSIYLVWNSILTILLGVMAFQNRRVAMLPLIPPTRADSANLLSLGFSTTAFGVAGLIMLCMGYYIIKRCHHRPRWMDQPLRVTIHSQEDLDRLRRGETIMLGNLG